MLLPGAIPAHDARCAAVGNRDMSTPISAMIGFGGPLPDPGDGVEVVTGLFERDAGLVGVRRRTGVDLVVEPGDGRFEVSDVVEAQPDQQGVVVAEPAPQRVAQLGDLLAQLALGQLGEHLGVALTGDQSGAASPGPTRPARPTATESNLMPASSRVFWMR